MRGLPSRSSPAGASAFWPALMHDELDCRRRFPDDMSTNWGDEVQQEFSVVEGS
jgi:hypothetical protein